MQTTESSAHNQPIATSDGRRFVILHYHYFKNAGTTFDAILQQTFPGRWVTREFEGPLPDKAQALRQWIEETPEAVCFSSHTAELPPPEIVGTFILPVLFIRHPLDRIRSAYEFERRQPISTYGSRLAKEKNLAEYIEVRLGHDRQCRNFHTLRLSRMYPPAQGSELERALRALSSLPVVGFVDGFEESLAHINTHLKLLGLKTELMKDHKPANTSAQFPRPLAESLSTMESEVGSDLYERLLRINADDMAVYERVKSTHALLDA